MTVPADRLADGQNKNAVLETRCKDRSLHLVVFSLPRQDHLASPETAFDRLRMSYGAKTSKVTARSPATRVEMGGLPAFRAEVCTRDQDGVSNTCMMFVGQSMRNGP